MNDAPVVAATASLTTNEDTAVSGQVTASDVDGDTLGYTVAQGPANGALSLNAATGAYTYNPGANFNGSDSFQVTVADGNGGSVTQTVNVGVAAVNDAPVVAATASLTTNEDTAVSGQVVASDVDGDTLGYSVAQGPANGTLSLDATTGKYVYAAAANYSGSDGFKVLVSDGHGGTATQTVNVAVGAVADAPTLSVNNVTVPAGITLTGTSGADTLRGTAGDDFISGGAGDDTLYGNGGPNGSKTVALSIGANLVDTDGSESLSIRIGGVPASATLSAGTHNSDGTWSLTSAQLAGLTLTTANARDVTLTIAATATEASGPSATTTKTLSVHFDQGTDSDTIDGGAGNDKIYGGNGNNVLIDGDGNDFVYGNGGNDTFRVGSGVDIYDGGAGIDTADFSGSASSVTANLALGTAAGTATGSDKLVSIENLTGSASADTLTGSASDNRIDGGAGNDQIAGGAGNDTLYGGDGNDQINGGSGNDVIYDGAGNDTVTAGDGNDYIFAGSGTDKYVGGTGFDTLDYSAATNGINVDAGKKTVLGYTDDKLDGIEKIIGTSFDDNFIGGKASNFFDGGLGNDTFRGMGGADTYSGGAGNDTFNWYVKDVQQGSNYLGADMITDFTRGADKLNLHEFVKAFPTSPIDSVVHTVDSAVGTMISVKIGTVFLDLVMLQGVHNVTASAWVASGDILV